MIKIYKIGGNVINNSNNLRKFLKEFALVDGKKILVHGGGKEATELSEKIGIETKMINGRRVTDLKTLDLVTMVYAGLINKRIVSILQEFDCNAVGLSGADGNLIPAMKRNPNPVDFGFVGDIDPSKINLSFISLLIEKSYVPVFCAICRNPEGGLLNCNADSIASALALACSKLEKTDLIYCFEKKGVLSEVDNDDSLIPLINPKLFNSLVADGKISGGMIPKVSNALDAVTKGVNSVMIRHSSDLHLECGTIIKN